MKPLRSVQSGTVRVCLFWFVPFQSISIHFILFHSVSFCFVLFCSVSFCFIPFHSIPFHSIPFPIPFRSVCACNDIENLFLFNSISISSSRSAPLCSAPFRACLFWFVPFQSISIHFILFHSVSFCFVLFHSIPFHSIPFHSPFRSAPWVHVMI